MRRFTIEQLSGVKEAAGRVKNSIKGNEKRSHQLPDRTASLNYAANFWGNFTVFLVPLINPKSQNPIKR